MISGQTLDQKWYVAVNKRTGEEGRVLIGCVNLGEKRERERERVYMGVDQ